MSQVAKTRILWLMLSVIAWAGIEYPLAHPGRNQCTAPARRGGTDDDNSVSAQNPLNLGRRALAAPPTRDPGTSAYVFLRHRNRPINPAAFRVTIIKFYCPNGRGDAFTQSRP